MKLEEYKTMYDLESTYWWYVGRRSIIRHFLRLHQRGSLGRILDVGCGTGINLGLLGEFGRDVMGIDTSPEALHYCHLRGFTNTSLMRGEYDIDVPDKSVAMVSMLDVLEHVEDEDRILQQIKRVLMPGGLLLVTVPAYQFLWSEHDIALHHKRRYTAQKLRTVLENNGLSVVGMSYCITFLLPVIVCYRLIKGGLNLFLHNAPTTSHVQLPKALNNLLVFFLGVEAKLLSHLSLPFGTSIIAVVKNNS